VLERLPSWVTLVRAPNRGPMTLDGTNTWVLRAPDAPAVVVDPGPLIEEHLERVAGQAPVGLVLATHSHSDHVEGLPRFRELIAAPSGSVPARRAADAAQAIRLTTVATPGHTADSVSYLAEYGDERVLLTGDTILGRGTTVVAYPDGELGEYLASLRRLEGYRGVPVLPGHGPALADAGAAATFYLRHRLARLDQVRAAVAGGAGTPDEVVAIVYADVDRSLWPAAQLSVRAQLAYLDAGRESTAGTAQLDPP
jgi:glyoxylase-like metal-dependent hydrolase (beta-lactamase superfamily II)